MKFRIHTSGLIVSIAIIAFFSPAAVAGETAGFGLLGELFDGGFNQPAPLLPPPTDLVCEGTVFDVAVTWINNYPYTTIEIWVNGVLQDTIAGTAMNYSFVPPDRGYYSIIVCGVEGDDKGCSDECSLIWGFSEEWLVWDFDADDGGFTAEPPDGWEWGLPLQGMCASRTEGNVWATGLDSTYTDNVCWLLDSSPLDISYSGTFLCIDVCYDMELGFDGGNLWFTTDDYWYYLIEPEEGYDGVMPQTLPCPWVNGKPAFTGNSGGWVNRCWDLTDPIWAGEQIRMRFAFGSDASGQAEGWMIDNISIYVNFGPRPVVDYVIVPLAGTVPFTTNHTVEMYHTYYSPRRLAGRIDVTIGNGASFSNWKSGWSNIDVGEIVTRSWNTNFPGLGSVVGDNTFLFQLTDVTPSPYNQVPYPPSGDTDTAVQRVTATAP